MNKFLKFPLYAALFAVTTIGFASCDDDEEEGGEGTEAQAATNKLIFTAYANNTVIPTYTTLADRSITLQAACQALLDKPSQEKVAAACTAWKSARETWERSEAFLYGPVEDYNIDPHIDTWPLDQTLWNQMINNQTLMNSLTVEQAKSLDDNVCGFHAIEYVLFRESNPRLLSDIPASELRFSAILSADLRNHCILLEASWRGLTAVSAAKQAMLSEAKMTLNSDKGTDYAQKLITAGESGNSTYKSQLASYEDILSFCSDIANEVGATKIGDPVKSQNVLDVESWYSWNSITDFADNIRSIKNAYLGGLDDNSREATYSVSSYIKGLDADLDTQIKTAINKAITEVEAMPAPFRNHLQESESKAAANACLALRDLLDEAVETIKK